MVSSSPSLNSLRKAVASGARAVASVSSRDSAAFAAAGPNGFHTQSSCSIVVVAAAASAASPTARYTTTRAEWAAHLRSTATRRAQSVGASRAALAFS